jgi:hypothetical protein
VNANESELSFPFVSGVQGDQIGLILANFRPLGDCLHWAVVLKITEKAQFFVMHISTEKIRYCMT